MNQKHSNIILRALAYQNRLPSFDDIILSEVKRKCDSQQFSSGCNKLFESSTFDINFEKLEKFPFSIRVANIDDLDSLLQLEENCWEPHLRLTSERIVSRLLANKDESEIFVAFEDHKMIAALYTQRILSIGSLFESDVMFSNLDSLRCPNGAVLQLLGICSLPSYSHLQVGITLRNYVLMLAMTDKSIVSVTAMTRCSNFKGKMNTEYSEYVFQNSSENACYVPSHVDPTLNFHTSGGAVISKIVPNYRPEDTSNLGNAVNIQYLIDDSNSDFSFIKNYSQVKNSLPHNSGAGPELIEFELLSSIVFRILNNCNDDGYLSNNIIDTPFMNIGLDSLQMTEVIIELQKIYSKKKLNSTLLFDYPTPRKLLAFLNDNQSSNTAHHQHNVSSDEGEEFYAVVGMSCNFPGSNSPNVFFDNLCNKYDAIQKVPVEWNSRDSEYSDYASFLDEESSQYFDPAFYGLTLAEASSMDPHHRVLLDVSFEALHISGILDLEIINSENCKLRFVPKLYDIGVFVGMSNNDNNCTQSNQFDSEYGAYSGINMASSSASNRISHIFGLTGPSLVVDTACSSSLSALHLACNSLSLGDCKVAVVAAADLLVSKYCIEIRKASQMLSKDGHCKVFDASADGYVRGEGAGAVVIKRLRDAQEEECSLKSGTRILGIIRSTAMNHNGTSAAFTAPNGVAQKDLLAKSLKRANIHVDDLVYFETHGTGTKLGDPIEWGAINEILIKSRKKKTGTEKVPLVIGAVKSNIGHLEATAGLAGLIKTLLVLKNLKIPPNLHLKELNPIIKKDSSDSVIFPSEVIDIVPQTKDSLICAGVSSFGSGGTNAQVILQKYVDSSSNRSNSGTDAEIFNTFVKNDSKVCFMFTGQASNYPDMGCDLYATNKTFKEVIDRCSVKVNLTPSLVSVMYPSIYQPNKDDNTKEKIETNSHLDDPVYSQLSIVVLELALAYLYMENNIQPSVVIGHSLGEYPAAVICGLLTESECLSLVYSRAKAVESQASVNKGRMFAVRASQPEMEDRISEFSVNEPLHISIAAVNGPTSIVISGNAPDVQKVLSSGVSHKKLNSEVAYHSILMQTTANSFHENFPVIEPKFNSSISFYSTVLGVKLTASNYIPKDYWAKHIINPVLFYQGIKAISESENISIFLEIGPQSILKKLASNCVKDSLHYRWVSSLEKDKNSAQTFDSSLLYLRGYKFYYRPIHMPWRCMNYEKVNTDSNQNKRHFPNSSDSSNQAMIESVIFDVVKKLLPLNMIPLLTSDISLFKLGLDSLGAVEIRNKLALAIKMPKLPLNIIYTYPTIEKLQFYFNTTKFNLQKVEPLISKLENDINISKIASNYDNFDKNKEMYRFSTTNIQNAIIFKFSQDPNSYFEFFEWSINDSLNSNFDINTFIIAFECLIRKHEVLRSSFDMDSKPSINQIVWHPKHPYFSPQNWFRVISSSNLSTNDLEMSQMENININHPPLFNLHLIENRNNDDSTIRFKFCVHHLLVDGWSMNVLIKDLSEIYKRLVLKQITPDSFLGIDLSSSFSEYSKIENSISLLSTQNDEHKIYWTEYFKGIDIENLFCPQSFPNDNFIHRKKIDLDKLLIDKLLELALDLETALGCLLHCIWSLTYYSLIPTSKSSGNFEVMYGYTTNARTGQVDLISEVVGPIIHTLPMYNSLSLDSNMLEFIKNIQNKLSSNLLHQDYQLPDMKNLVNKGSYIEDIFSAIFDFQRLNLSSQLSPSCHLNFVDFHDKVGYPLSARVYHVDEKMYQLSIVSESRELNDDKIETLASTFVSYLKNLSSSTCAMLLSGKLRDFVDNTSNNEVNKWKYSADSSSEETELESYKDDNNKNTIFYTLSSLESKNFIIEQLKSIWSDILNHPIHYLNNKSNFFALGGNSLTSVQIVSKCRKIGLEIKIPDIFNFPNLEDLAGKICSNIKILGPAVLGTHKNDNYEDSPFTLSEEDLVSLSPDQESSFPLIGINQAHFVGLYTSMYSDKGVSPQIYFEWDIKSLAGEKERLDIGIFEIVLNTFIKRHMVFQTYCTDDGYMKKIEPLEHYKIKYQEFSSSTSKSDLSNIRSVMLNGIIDPKKWPLFEFYVSHTGLSSSVIHIRVSLFLLDAMSDLIFRQEVSDMYRMAQKISSEGRVITSEEILSILPKRSSELSFNIYCRAINKHLTLSERYKTSYLFWQNRLNTLPDGPAFPLLTNKSNEVNLNGNFKNFHVWISHNNWKSIKSYCAFYGITLPVFLLTIYSISISRWSGKKHFLINVLQCLRHQIHKDVNKMLGNCSSTLLCEIDLRNNNNSKTSLSFIDCARRIAMELAQNLQHSIVSGIDIMQELNRVNGRTFQVVAPFIFTSPIGVESANSDINKSSWIFEETFFSEKVPHTACVNAIKEYDNGTACASLDIIDGIFPTEVIEGFARSYKTLIEALSVDLHIWNNYFESILDSPKSVRSSDKLSQLPISDLLLSDGFVNHFTDSPKDLAIIQSSIDGDLSFSYDSLYNMTKFLIDKFRKLNILSCKGSSPIIAVYMSKGWEQITTVLSIVMSGCVYLPMDAGTWPENRVKEVLRLSGSVLLCTTHKDSLATNGWLKSLSVPFIDVNAVFNNTKSHTTFAEYSKNEFWPNSLGINESLAYLIYTSGSTGSPKGVACHHQGAVNTILDLNSQFCVKKSDKIFAISSLSFDLSVYDIFGIYFAGGTLFLPPAEIISPPDPFEWLKLLEMHQISIWNSVPAFMELLVSQAEIDNKMFPMSLRLIMLSGDWLPITLSSRIRKLSLNKDLRIISMGGATEAAIWSNMFELGVGVGVQGDPDGIPKHWASVPYGVPLRNQSMYILDENLVECELWVTGEIYIGGIGVANGYHNDPSRTANQFIFHPITHEKLFRTGDLGRVRPEYLLEIVGRKDTQVKINGFRIELGEIEKLLQTHKDVQSAALAIHNNTLCAYIILNPNSLDDVISIQSNLEVLCRKNLTDYMIPRHFIVLEKLPLSPNGKLMREKLKAPDFSSSKRLVNNSITQLPYIEDLFVLFKNTLNIQADSVLAIQTQSFFHLGGTSVSAIQLIFHIQKQLGVKIHISELFTNSSIEQLSSLISNKKSSFDNNLIIGDAAVAFKYFNLSMNPDQNLPAIILINPAGASGLCYLDLAKSLKNYSVFAIDDDVVTSGKAFEYENIDDVVEQVFKIVKKIIIDHNLGAFSIGGWSYGGVVAILTALKLELTGIEVNTVITFDSPIVKKSKPIEYSMVENLKSNGKDNLDEQLIERSIDHFKKCTRLLNLFHSQFIYNNLHGMKSSLLEILPEDDCRQSNNSENQKLSPRHTTFISPGDHWNMIFFPHSEKIKMTIENHFNKFN